LSADALFRLGVDRKPLEAASDQASAPTFSRLENAATARDVYRMAKAFVDQFIASYAKAPAVMVLDMDHSEDATNGQQELAFYNHHYRNHCYLPLFIFEGLSGKFLTAALHSGKRPSGAENAMILKRVLTACTRLGPIPTSSCAVMATSPTRN
jgi:Transposase DDE domain group 1